MLYFVGLHHFCQKHQADNCYKGVLERFLSEEDCQTVRPFFAGLWGLEDLEAPATSEIVSKAIKNPDGFVLKPQREGGGNNLYGPLNAEVSEVIEPPVLTLNEVALCLHPVLSCVHLNAVMCFVS